MVTFVNQFLAILVIGSQILSITLILVSLISKDAKNDIVKFLKPNALKLALLVVLTAVLGSLFYSEVAGYEPCKLCWYQRIFMYPQLVLLSIALFKKDKNIVDYILGLSVFGFFIAAYHYLMQIGWLPALSCASIGYSASCAKEFVMQFGFVTIPLMSATALFIIIALMTSVKMKVK